ncbi:MAG: hypothetical protein LBT43_22060 [Prevotella sp.]|nr:hypothetical protein [Prevotella sp.]
MSFVGFFILRATGSRASKHNTRQPSRISDAGGYLSGAAGVERDGAIARLSLSAGKTVLAPSPFGEGGGRSNGALAFWLVLGNAKMNIQTERSVVDNNRTILYNTNNLNRRLIPPYNHKIKAGYTNASGFPYILI